MKQDQTQEASPQDENIPEDIVEEKKTLPQEQLINEIQDFSLYLKRQS